MTTDSARVDEFLAEHAAVIRALGKRVVGDVIEIGRRLAECKKIAGHGGWLPWLEREFGWEERTAQRFISVHELALKSDNLSDLNVPISSLYLLAAPSTPDEARIAVIERAEAGERLRHEEVKAIIATHSPQAVLQAARELGAEPQGRSGNTGVGMHLGIKYQVQRLRKSVDAPCFSSAF